MRNFIIYIILPIAALFNGLNLSHAQETTVSDTGKVYRKIESFSGKRHLTRLLYPVVFKTTTLSGERSASVPSVINNLSQCEGKILRSVQIKSYDPFTFRLPDTVIESNSWIAKAGNTIHIRTLPLAIRNLLLIKKEDVFDSLLVKESIRLVRKQSYVRDVHFDARVVNDSVDLMVLVQDVWSIVPDGSWTGNRLNISLKEQNFLGTGQQFRAEQVSNLSSGKSWYNLNYNIPNIDNSYINTQLAYNQEENGGFTKSVRINRPFYSSYTRWAGGLALEEYSKHDSIHPGPEIFLPHYRYTVQDYWLGTAWPLFNGNTELERNTNLMVSNRWYKINYRGFPPEINDTAGLITDQFMYLIGIGLNSRKYLQDRYLFRYGVTEDIPVGRTYMLLGGIREKQGRTSYYLAVRGHWADYYSFGYLGCKAEWGTFLANGYKREASGLFGISYFTSLHTIGSWKFRQFVKGELAFGSNLLPSVKIAFDPYMGTSGFDEAYPIIRTKGVITFQTQAYAPWNIIGFRFGPYLQGSLGFLSGDEFSIKRAKVFTHLGVGVLIRNDFLNASFLQISVSYYPVIPSVGNHVFRSNTFTTRDFGLMEFESGKPETISLQ